MAERDFRKIGRFPALNEVELGGDDSLGRAAGFAYAGSLEQKIRFQQERLDL